MSAARVSVLVPCFNHGQWIDEAIDSVLAQTVQDWEVIVVDDGSTDPATVEKLAALDRPRTRVVRTENRGLPAARNLAASLASGQFYCALDADDWLAPTWFERALAAFDREPDLGFVSHWLEAFGDEQWSWRPERCELPDLLARNVVNSAALVRRRVYDAVGGFDEAMQSGCEDWDFWLRIVEAGFRGTVVPEVHYYYRRSASSMSRRMTQSADVYREPLDQLVRKHVSALRSHAIDVLVSKERERAALQREIHRLERDYLTALAPPLARAREEAASVDRERLRIAALEDDVTRLETERVSIHHDRIRLHEEVNLLRNEAATWRERATALQADAAALRTDNAGLREYAAERNREVGDLRASWSWWVTRPMRALAALWLRE